MAISLFGHFCRPLCRPISLVLLLPTLLAASGVAFADNPKQSTDSNESQPSSRLTRDDLVKRVLSQHPSVRASHARARAAELRAQAERKLPDPEVSADIWQVPITRPYAVYDSPMIMFGIRQSFLAPSVLEARARAKLAEASIERETASDKERELIRDTEHAYADLVEAHRKAASRARFKSATLRMAETARARLAAGQNPIELAQIELELAKIDIDIANDEAAIHSAKVKINGLLGVPVDSAVQEPTDEPAVTVQLSNDDSSRDTSNQRADLREALARQKARQAEINVLEKESKWPMFTVGVSYFPATAMQPNHGYGASFAMSLPWVWGGTYSRYQAEQSALRADLAEIESAERRQQNDKAKAIAALQLAEKKLTLVRSKLRPATEKNVQFTMALLASPRGELMPVIAAERARYEAEMADIDAQSALEHAIVDLDASAGKKYPRVPIDLPDVASIPQNTDSAPAKVSGSPSNSNPVAPSKEEVSQ